MNTKAKFKRRAEMRRKLAAIDADLMSKPRPCTVRLAEGCEVKVFETSRVTLPPGGHATVTPAGLLRIVLPGEAK